MNLQSRAGTLPAGLTLLPVAVLTGQFASTWTAVPAAEQPPSPDASEQTAVGALEPTKTVADDIAPVVDDVEGGLGFGGLTAGGSAIVMGFVATQFQRWARRKAPDRIQWIFRTVHSASGRHVCVVQRSSHSWGTRAR